MIQGTIDRCHNGAVAGCASETIGNDAQVAIAQLDRQLSGMPAHQAQLMVGQGNAVRTRHGLASPSRFARSPSSNSKLGFGLLLALVLLPLRIAHWGHEGFASAGREPLAVSHKVARGRAPALLGTAGLVSIPERSIQTQIQTQQTERWRLFGHFPSHAPSCRR